MQGAVEVGAMLERAVPGGVPGLWGELSLMHVIGIAIWAGLAALTVGLLLLIRSPWGKDKPLAKCVVLSVLAHLLLMALAYATQFVTGKAPPEPVFRITALETTGSDEAEEDLREADSPKPWELSQETLSVPAAALDAAAEPAARRAEDLPLPSTAFDRRPDEMAIPRELLRTETPPRRTATVAASMEPPTATEPAEPDAGPEEVLRQVRAEASSPTVAQSDPAVGEWTELPAPPPKMLPSEPAVADRVGKQSRREPLDLVPLAEVTPNVPTRPSGDESWQRAKPLPESAVRRKLAELPPLARPGDAQPIPQIYRLRLDAERRRWFLQLGGSLEALRSVERGLEWLAAHQSSDGRWDPARYGAGGEGHVLGHDRQGAGARADTGMTGLALLALLGAGQTHYQGEHAAAVRKGIDFLCRVQRPDGSLSGDSKLFAATYCHGMASLALSEAYAMTGDPRLREPVQRAVRFSLRSQALQGGWRYQPGDPGDMSQFGWQVMMLSSAHQAGIPLPSTERLRMRRFLDRCSSGPGLVLAGYRPGERATPTMTAEAMVTRVFLGVVPAPSALPAFREMLRRDMPHEGRANLYYWYYGTLALHQLQDDLWPEWSRKLQAQLIRRQRTDGDLKGSWDADTTWGGYGGRVYSTALAAMTLEVYVRYLPLYAWRR